MAAGAAPKGAPLWRSVFNTRMIICVFCGFSSGMPLYVLYQLLPAWMRSQGADLSTISLFSLIAFPYTWKFIWAPLMDRYTLPGLGRRRGWALLCQIALMLILASLSALNPSSDLPLIAAVAGLTALFSASQDIVLDAYRRELLPDEELGMGNSWFVNAYRISSLIPGSLALILADRIPWSQVHLIVAAWMLVGILTTLLMPEPAVTEPGPDSFQEAVLDPFREFFGRAGVRSALLILAFMLFYKIGDSMATALATPFYLDMGFSMTEIGTIAKAATLWASVSGAMIGGVVMIKLGINRSLWLFGVIQLLSILGFAGLSTDSTIQPIVQARPLQDLSMLPAAALPHVQLAAEPDAAGDLIRRVDANTASAEVLASLEPIAAQDDPAAVAAAIIDARPLTGLHQLPATARSAGALLTVQTNLNTTSRAALSAHALLTEAHAEAIVEARSGGLLTDLSALSLPADFTPLATLRIDPNTATPAELALLPGLAPSATLLFLVVSFEYLGVGLGTAAFVAFIARSTNKRYTATQFALLTSLTGIPRTFANATTGYLIESLGYTPFFLLCTAIAIPGMILLIWVAPFGADPVSDDG